MIKNTKTRVIVSIDKDIADLLENETIRSDRSKSEIILAALNYYLYNECGWIRPDEKWF